MDGSLLTVFLIDKHSTHPFDPIIHHYGWVWMNPKLDGFMDIHSFQHLQLWSFPLGPNSFQHKVIKSKYGLEINGWDTNKVNNTTHKSPWKFISQVYSSYIHLLYCNVQEGSCFHLQRIFSRERLLFWIGFHVFIIYLPYMMLLFLFLSIEELLVFLMTFIF